MHGWPVLKICLVLFAVPAQAHFLLYARSNTTSTGWQPRINAVLREAVVAKGGFKTND